MQKVCNTCKTVVITLCNCCDTNPTLCTTHTLHMCYNNTQLVDLFFRLNPLAAMITFPATFQEFLCFCVVSSVSGTSTLNSELSMSISCASFPSALKSFSLASRSLASLRRFSSMLGVMGCDLMWTIFPSFARFAVRRLQTIQFYSHVSTIHKNKL